ncbi:MAG: ABC transporter ATP-binding protein [Deltaproteobacteria bacterium]|nr:ABC transporter ATP-binding protein [Deltaproteobacteria bacterium]
MQPQPQAPSSTQSAAEPQSIISVQNVTVAYRSYKERPSSLKESVIRLMRTGKFAGSMTMEALSNVSLTIPKGAVYGLIGSNGSGKSTMLKVLAQVLKPTGGTVTVKGTVASLIELGVGFDPELNAIENIYLNGSLHKRSRAQIKSRVESIIEFAELREFATTPIKYYSSGMAARLGFSVAIEIDPDILLVDEILAVGDERFQVKCMEVFHRLLREGKTIVIVSHDLDMIARTASRIGLLSRGHLVFDGDPRTAVQMYRDSSYQTALTHS